MSWFKLICIKLMLHLNRFRTNYSVTPSTSSPHRMTIPQVIRIRFHGLVEGVGFKKGPRACFCGKSGNLGYPFKVGSRRNDPTHLLTRKLLCKKHPKDCLIWGVFSDSPHEVKIWSCSNSPPKQWDAFGVCWNHGATYRIQNMEGIWKMQGVMRMSWVSFS